jgi:Fe2+ or Zn2+ uptake regulation protein
MYKELLKEHKLSITQKRISILEALDTASEPVTIDDLKKSIGKDIDVSTLYRSLKTLVDVGIIYQTDFREGVSYFEFQKDHHHHITCTECKSRTSIDICIGDNFSRLAQKKGYTVTNHIFELFGLCTNCLKS